jgi:alkaline phosphatase D
MIYPAMPLRVTSLFLITFALILTGCGSPDDASTDEASTAATTADVNEDVVLRRIAFGSCNDQGDDQPLWTNIRQHDPDLWVWLGDNIYGDTRDMSVLQAKYERQQSNASYQQLVAATRIVGTWDDHDYGANDAGRYYPKRDSSQQLFLDFMGVPDDHPRRNREGVYAAHTYGPPGQRVKVILLDTRYHRDSLAVDPDSGRRYQAGPGDFLGEAQWAWLDNELSNSDAQIHLIGSSIQIIPEQHGWEKWANFPEARQRLFDTIRASGASGVILVSGDRHLAELSRRDDVLDYPLYDLTASGLTHSYEGAEEPNRYRVGSLYDGLNYGLMQIDWEAEPTEIILQVRGRDDQVAIADTLSLADLQPG